MKVEVFLRSVSLSPKFETLIYSCEHNACAPELLRQVDKQFSGRVLEPGSVALFGRLERLQGRVGSDLHIYDVGRFPGWIRALRVGVSETPALIVDGEKHLGLEAARSALAMLEKNALGELALTVGGDM